MINRVEYQHKERMIRSINNLTKSINNLSNKFEDPTLTVVNFERNKENYGQIIIHVEDINKVGEIIQKEMHDNVDYSVESCCDKLAEKGIKILKFNYYTIYFGMG